MNQSNRPEILHEDRIDSRVGESSHMILERRKLVSENERVERDEARQAATMQRLHQAREIFEREVGCAGAGVETGLKSEIDRIRTILDSSVDAFPVSRRGQQLGR
jgi:hypothetical protein